MIRPGIFLRIKRSWGYILSSIKQHGFSPR